jgi:hypothetical protein
MHKNYMLAVYQVEEIFMMAEVGVSSTVEPTA